MFLRRKTKAVRGVGYSYWNLCETYRTARGPRQRVVASLGKLDENELIGLKGGWEDLPALLRGEEPASPPAPAHLPGFAPASPPGQWEQVDVRNLRVERNTRTGVVVIPAAH